MCLFNILLLLVTIVAGSECGITELHFASKSRWKKYYKAMVLILTLEVLKSWNKSLLQFKNFTNRIDNILFLKVLTNFSEKQDFSLLKMYALLM